MSRGPNVQEQAALQMIGEALTKATPGRERDVLEVIATATIGLMHGTYGTEYIAAYLREASADVASPNPLRIKLEVRPRPGGH